MDQAFDSERMRLFGSDETYVKSLLFCWNP